MLNIEVQSLRKTMMIQCGPQIFIFEVYHKIDIFSNFYFSFKEYKFVTGAQFSGEEIDLPFGFFIHTQMDEILNRFAQNPRKLDVLLLKDN